MSTIHIAGERIPVTATYPEINVSAVLEFAPFKEWADAMSSEKSQSAERNNLEIKKIEIQNVDYFGSKIGFVKFKVDARLVDNGKNVPGIIFMVRGGSVAVLLILKSKDGDNVTEEHAVLTSQARLAVPSLSFQEIPAGMLDGSGNFCGKAAEEIKEETGIEITENDLIDMTDLTHGTAFRGVYPSPGGCDEFMRLCLCVKEMKREDVLKLEGKLSGMRDHGESITVRLVKLDDLWKIPDMKALSALALYHALRKEGKI
ncbi:10794_t:CDS:2 [Paraglomus brasilianum]|uniref:10794_t:CDS:1 n=1 Tax=Paraglomus brasilianum TaxID=144538 RepID=A0A9N9A7S8_9GLOM|nr:10794_t:CDS:2 [Paraglomus brasilianum]